MAVILKKFTQTNQDNLEGSKKYIKLLKLLAALSTLSRVHVPTILNFAQFTTRILLTPM